MLHAIVLALGVIGAEPQQQELSPIDAALAAPPANQPRWFGFFSDVASGVDVFSLGDGVDVVPTAAVVGGVGLEHIERAPTSDDQRQDRATTIALARTGMFDIGKHIQIESELELNAGPYGSSVWEGQAAIQVRNQLVRVRIPGLVYDDALQLELGRITDMSSVNYVSNHTGDQLYTDEVARMPLLMAGFNRGNGAAVHYTLFDAVTLGVTFNAGNPTSNTGSLMLGGTFPPFARFYEVPYASVGKDASRFPLTSFHVLLLAPSLSLDTHWVRAHASMQLVHADTNMNSEKDEPLEGFNLRAGVAATLLENVLWSSNSLVLFGNLSRIENDVVRPQNLAQIQDGRYEGWVASTGVDVNLWGKSGVGAEMAIVREREPGRPPVLWQFANAGATWWLNDVFAVGVRGAYEQRCADTDCTVDGVRSLFITGRLVLDAATPRTQKDSSCP